MSGFPQIDSAAIEAEKGRQKAAAQRRKRRGIYFDKQYQKWHVRASIGNKIHHVGRYESLEEAIKARDEFNPDTPRKHSGWGGVRAKADDVTFEESRETAKVAVKRTKEWFIAESKRQLKELPKKYA